MGRMHLFVIKKLDQDQYWNRSREHGTGWNPHYPKQSFSHSQLAMEISHLAKEGLGTQQIVVIELHA